MTSTDVWRRLAAAENAAWCDAVARSHGLAPSRDAAWWWSPVRTPTFYPDAVTCTADARPDEVLRRIDRSPGCSVKDSFASLDLAAHGFGVLFEARWIVRRARPLPAPATALRWSRVATPAALAAWVRAWAAPHGPPDVFRPGLLALPSVLVFAGRLDRRVVAGGALHRQGAVVGVSNVFAAPEHRDAAWAGALALADRWAPRRPAIVGYETGPALVEALGLGFEDVGPLRVWMHADGAAGRSDGPRSPAARATRL